MKHEFTAFWLKPEAERHGISDSLLLSSGTEIFSAVLDKKWHVFLRVCGDVRILWKDEIYKDVSQFPDELKEFIRTKNIFVDSLPEDSSVINNNWYELFIYDDENNCVTSDVCDIDIQELTEEDVKEFIKDELDGYIKQDFINRWDGDEYPGPDNLAAEMKKHFCQESRFVDSKIDDGVTEQGSEDTYVMKDCFALEDETTIDIFYGDNTRLIGYIEINEP